MHCLLWIRIVYDNNIFLKKMLTEKSENDKLIECQIWKMKNDSKKVFQKTFDKKRQIW